MRYLTVLFLIGLLSGCRAIAMDIEQMPTSMPIGATVRPVDVAIATIEATATPAVILMSTSTATPHPSVRPTSTSIARSPEPRASPKVPAILSFTVEPGEVDPGESVTLHWHTANASRVVLQERGLPGRLHGHTTYNDLDVAPNGDMVWKVADRGWAQSVLRLEVYDAARSDWREVVVDVHCTYSYFFNQRRKDCPSGPASTSDAADQRFEDGRMIWTADGQTIYQLVDGGGLWIYQDTWTEDQPTNDPTIVPPDGRYQPVRGFGKVWRATHQSLGWALASEQGYQTQIQRSLVGCRTIFEAGFYIQLSDGRIVHICDGWKLPGYWEYITP